MKVVVIGTGPAGTFAALEARRYDREAEVILIGREKYPEYSHCGMPYVLSGEVKDFDELISHPERFYKDVAKIDLRLETNTEKIFPKEKKIITDKGEIEFDKLVIATGSSPFVPPIPGADLKGVSTLGSAEDLLKLKELAKGAKKAVVIGSGLVGLEAAISLRDFGLEVTVVERMEKLMHQMLDDEIAKEIENYLESKDIKMHHGKSVEEIAGKDKVESVKFDGEALDCDLVVMATGMRCNTEIAKDAGIKIGKFGGIIIDPEMKTNVDGIYAAGDCVECIDHITGKPTMSMLGTTAVKQGKVAGANVAGKKKKFPPVLNSAITKLFDIQAGSAGLTEDKLKEAGIDYISAKFKGETKCKYMPGNGELTIKLIADLKGRLLGCQVFGKEGVFARVSYLGLAIQKNMTLEELTMAEIPYAPPISPAVDPIYTVAELLMRKLERTK
ncbi:FAD-dependent oxidoreductase [Candidatus Undinarchaeota archaeon]